LLLERKKGVLHLEQGLSQSFKDSLERTRRWQMSPYHLIIFKLKGKSIFKLLYREKASELKKAIFLVKSHVEAGHDRRISHLFPSLSSASSDISGIDDSDHIQVPEGQQSSMDDIIERDSESIHSVDELELAANTLLSGS
jgi:hypothetical protein